MPGSMAENSHHVKDFFRDAQLYFSIILTLEVEAMQDVRDHIETRFIQWANSVDRILQPEYAITIEDIGISESTLGKIWKSGETPAEYVRWFGQKYDLISRDNWLRSAFKDRLAMKFK